METLLNITAKKLGTTPEKLKEAAENGTMQNILGNNAQAQMLSKVLSDPEAAKKMLSTPQAMQLLKMFSKN